MIRYILIFILGAIIGYFACLKTTQKETPIANAEKNTTVANNEYEYILYNEKAELKTVLNSLYKDCASKQNSFFTLTIKDKNETYNLKVDSNHSDFLEKHNNLNAVYAECKDTNSSVKYRFLSHREQILR